MRSLGWLTVVLLSTACTGVSAVPERTAPADARPGGVVRVAITAPGSVDPGNLYEPMGDLVVRTMCDPLIAVDPSNGELRPGLLRSWVVSDSGQRLVLRLRKGLRFSDGTPVTADDVAFTLARVASSEFASASAAQLEAIEGYPEVHGDIEPDEEVDRRRLRGVTAVDEESVDITLRSRQADFLRVLTSRLTTPVPRDRATRDPAAFARQPVCSGPYTLTAPYRPGDRQIRLDRVPGYRSGDSTLTRGGAGYADSVEFQVFADGGAAARAQRTGKVDVAAAQPTDTSQLQEVPGPTVEYVGFPTATGPLFDKPVVRRALSLALDRERLVREVFPGTRVVATGFLPPTTAPVYRPGACAELPARGDLGAARALLAEAGADLRGLRVPLFANTDGRNRQLAEAVARQWRDALGLQVVVTPSDFRTFLRRGATAGGFPGPFRFSWATPYADPDGYLYPLFSTERIGRDNVSRFSSPDFDRVLGRQARQAEDAADRVLEYRSAEQLLCRELPMLPLTFGLSRYLVSPRLASATDTFLDRSTGLPLLRELHITG